MTLVSNILANKHTSIAGIVYLVAKFGTDIMAIWMPEHADKFRSTANVIEGAAVAYGLMSAGDASKGLSKAEADTTFVKKEDAKQ